MTTYTLQDVLAFVEEDERFLRWVAEIEQPKPWKHDPVDDSGDDGIVQSCVKECKAYRVYNDRLTNKWGPWRDEDNQPMPHCTVPDRLTKSLPEIVEEKLKRVDLTQLARSMKDNTFPSLTKPMSMTTGPDLIFWLCNAYEWFIKAGAKMQYVVLTVAGGKVKTE